MQETCILVFETSAFNRSATSPEQSLGSGGGQSNGQRQKAGQESGNGCDVAF